MRFQRLLLVQPGRLEPGPFGPNPSEALNPALTPCAVTHPCRASLQTASTLRCTYVSSGCSSSSSSAWQPHAERKGSQMCFVLPTSSANVSPPAAPPAPQQSVAIRGIELNGVTTHAFRGRECSETTQGAFGVWRAVPRTDTRELGALEDGSSGSPALAHSSLYLYRHKGHTFHWCMSDSATRLSRG